MPWSMKDMASTDYDDTQHPWDSMFNGPNTNSLRQSPYTEQLMANAEFLSTAPTEFIRDNLTHAPMMDWGSPRPQPTIEGVLGGESLQPVQANLSDYTGTPAGAEASPRNAISVEGG